MNEEKSTIYISPKVEIIEVAVERGFVNSTEDYEDGIWQTF